MRVVVLMGSPRKKDSYRICRLIEKNLAGGDGFTFEYIFLPDYHIEDCKGCDQCFQKGEACCPCKDDLHIIKEKLQSADALIFSSPVYACQITGLLKRTLDRLSYLFHRQELVGKPALTVVTTGGGGQKPASGYLKMVACGWGCNLIGEISVISPMFFESGRPQTVWGFNQKYRCQRLEKIQQITRNFRKALLDGRAHIPTFYDIYMFQCLRSKTFVSKADYEFWKEKHWLDKHYFYDVKLNPAKQAFAVCIKRYVDFMAKKMLKPQK